MPAAKKKKTAEPKFHPMHAESPLWGEVDEWLKREIAKRKPRQKEIDRAREISDLLREEFPEAFCALDFGKPYQLMVATILSAQCTDERVNKVTPDLWKKFKGPKELANAPEGKLEEVIRSTGFFNSKAKSIRRASQSLLEEYNGKMPHRMEDLLSLQGVARKTANVIRMHAFGLPGLSIDTHVTRLANRLGLTKNQDAKKIEADIASLLPPERWTHFADALIWHGRKTCTARSPKCGACALQELCPSAFKVEEKKTHNSRKKKG